MATVYGNSNPNENIAGTSANDVIFAADGHNIVNAGNGNDVVFGGAGVDKVEGGAGDDVIFSGAGDDILSGGLGNDIVIAGQGNDILSGGLGNDILSGGSGDDTFQYGKGGFGNDIITDFVAGQDKIVFYADSIGSSKNITVSTVQDFIDLQSTAGVNVTYTDLGNGNVLADFGAAYGTIVLLNVGPQLLGISSSHNVTGNGLDNVLYSGPTYVHVVGGGGNDTLLSGAGGANMEGNAGDDKLAGGGGNDLIGGQAGNDILIGNGGDDNLAGGLGNDLLSGGDGADTFTFGLNFGNDVITDLNFAEGDHLTFLNAGPAGTASIDSLAELQSFITTSGATLTENNDSVTITWDGNHSLTLVGFADEL